MKRSLLSLGVAVAVMSSAIAPASAFEIKKEDADQCVVTVTAADRELIGKKDMAETTTLSFAQVKKLRADIVEVQEKVSRELTAKKKELTAAQKAKNEAKQKELEAQIAGLKNKETALLGIVTQTATCVLPSLDEISSLAKEGNISSVVSNLDIPGLNSSTQDGKSPLSSEEGKPNQVGLGLIIGSAVIAGLGLLATIVSFVAPLLHPVR